MKKFKKIYVEITNICNLNCSFCSDSGRRPAFIDAEAFSTILDQIKPYTQYIYLHVKGEPLLHPDFGKLLDISYNKGFKVNITTNGTLLKKLTPSLFNSKAVRQINISLHSFSEQSNNKTKSDYLKTIALFVKEALAKSNIYISLRLWNLQADGNNKENDNEFIINTIQDELDIQFPSLEIARNGESIKIADNLFLHFEYEFTWPNINASISNVKGFCLGLRNQIAILTDGTVVPCCLDSEGVIDLGNIHKVPFSKILISKRYTAIYNGFSANVAVEDLCQKCCFKERF